MADLPQKLPQKNPAEQAVDRYFDVLEKVQVSQPAGKPFEPQPKIDINDEIARERKIKNDNAEQDITLKRMTLMVLFIFLAIETALIFVIAFMQGLGLPHHFHLEEWSFKLVVTATLAQITGMLFVAVRYLFPTPNDRSDNGAS